MAGVFQMLPWHDTSAQPRSSARMMTNDGSGSGSLLCRWEHPQPIIGSQIRVSAIRLIESIPSNGWRIPHQNSDGYKQASVLPDAASSASLPDGGTDMKSMS